MNHQTLKQQKNRRPDDWQDISTQARLVSDWKPTTDFTNETLKERITWTKNLFHDLQHLFELHGWYFTTSNAKRRRGLCKYGRQRISLSKYYLKEATKQEIYDTLTHELAHALLGKKYGHGRVWQELHQLMGGSGERCCKKKLEGIKYKYEIWCDECNECIGKRLKKSKIVKNPSHYRCGGCKQTALRIKQLR